MIYNCVFSLYWQNTEKIGGYTVFELKKIAAESIFYAIKEIAPEVLISQEEVASMLAYPPDKSMGDLAFPCFKFSKLLRKSPIQISEILAEKIEINPYFSKIEPLSGYLNFYINGQSFTVKTVNGILACGEDYGKNHSGDKKTLVIDYSSPNVAKPFHIGHLGTTVIGHSLKLLYQFSGWNCIGINHLGDWGTQFGKLIVAYRKWGCEKDIIDGGIDALVSLYVRFHKEAEQNPDLNDLARTEFTKLEHHDEENIKLWKWFISISIKEYETTYNQLGIKFDYYTGESFYTDLMPAQVQILNDKNLMKIDDGASIVDLSEYNMPPCLILKRDGSTLYPTRDIAAAVYRKENYKFDKCIYVTSNQQILHFRQWFKVVELMGYDWHNELVHIPYGTVSINGAKLATRTGNVILLKDLFKMAIEKVGKIIAEKNPNLENKDEVAEAVGVGAVVFYYLSNSRIKDSDFNLDDALSFEGNTGPYAQYTYARCYSIIEKAKEIPSAESHIGYISCEAENELAKTVSLFSEKIEEAIRDSEPMVITRYIIDICAAFNRFYHDCQIISSENTEARNFRIRLTEAVKITLGNALSLICMKKTPKI